MTYATSRLAELRQRKLGKDGKPLTQFELAIRAGVPQSVISQAERWNIYPSTGNRRKIAAALNAEEKVIWPEPPSQRTDEAIQ